MASDQPDASSPRSSESIAATKAPTQFARGAVLAGRYRLMEQIGEGGMGFVWVAEQSEPVKRRVAIKLIKPGMDTRDVLSRFEAERQALALMDHPNIAKVHDGGMTDEGRPFFVMEYVKGVPITEYCDNARLPIRERLKLFISVCQAVQHAHQKGVIHRDLKPSNILVCLYDSQPVPKVIDFGLAKATGARLTEHTLYTAHGMMIGTPLYMSPEQAEFNNLDIDTRTDIYSLGVILYELLTGATPLERKQMKEAAFQEILRLIKEVEPLKPSTKLSSSANLPSVAAQRAIEPTKLSRILRGDLDWIVMKSLEKERSRRYETANGLGRDIERYLNDEPVEAGPPSAMYRLKKLAKKHRGALAAVGACAALLLIGATLSTWQAIRAKKAETIARASEEKARLATARALASAASESQTRKRAEAAAEAEREAKQTAQQSEAESKAVLDFVQNRVFAAAKPEGLGGGLGHSVTLRDAMKSALAFVDESFKEQPLIEARLRNTLGGSFMYLGEWQIASEQFEIAHRLYAQHLGPDHRTALRELNLVAMSYGALGRHEEALKLREKVVLQLNARHGPEDELTLFATGFLAGNLGTAGRHDEAIKLYEETLALARAKLGPDAFVTFSCATGLANEYANVGRHGDAMKLLEAILPLMEAKYGRDYPHTLDNIHSLAATYFAAGRHAEARQLFEETLMLRRTKLGDSHRDTLTTMVHLARSYAKLGRPKDALKLYEEVVPPMRSQLGPDHPWTLASMNELAYSYFTAGRHAEALRLFEETLVLRKSKLGDAHQETLGAMIHVARSYAALGRHAEALTLYEEMTPLMKANLGADHPYTLDSMNALACSYAAAGRHAEALQLFQENLELQKTKFGNGHKATLDTMSKLTGSYAALGRHAEALKVSQELLALRRSHLGPDHPDTLLALWEVAAGLMKLERGAEALPVIDEYLERAAGKVVDPRMIPAVMLLRLRHFEKARDAAGCRTTAEMWEKLNRPDADSLYVAACKRAATAAVIRSVDSSEAAAKEADAEADRAMDWLQKAVAAGYKNAAHMAKDKDLEALRERDDFKQLFATLEATQKKSGQ